MANAENRPLLGKILFGRNKDGASKRVYGYGLLAILSLFPAPGLAAIAATAALGSGIQGVRFESQIHEGEKERVRIQNLKSSTS